MALGSLVFTIIVVILGYRYYAKRVDRDIIQSDPNRATPAKMYNDGVDFMPFDRLAGHRCILHRMGAGLCVSDVGYAV